LRKIGTNVGMCRKFQSARCECQHFSRREYEHDIFDQDAVIFLWNVHAEHLWNFILTGCEREISFGYVAPGNNKSTMTHQFGVSRMRKNFLKIVLFKRVRDSWSLENVYWKFVIRKILPNLTYVHPLSVYRDEFQRKSAAAVVLVFIETFSAQIYLDNYYYYRCKDTRDRNQKLSKWWDHARSTYIYTECAKFIIFLKRDSWWTKLKLNICKSIITKY